MKPQYENHADEWRMERAKQTFEIKNPNYRPIYHPHDPRYTVEEGYCPTCQDYTTAYNRHGECEICGTEVRSKP